MDEQLLGGPAPQALRQLLDGSGEFTRPVAVLSDLSPEAALRVPPGAPHCIAAIVAHMHFWQAYMLGLIRQQAPAYPETEADGWPGISAMDWPAVTERFLADLTTLHALTKDEQLLAQEYKPNVTVGYLICDAALHNAYHLGQIVLLRCMLGLWPPAEGAGYGYWPQP